MAGWDGVWFSSFGRKLSFSNLRSCFKASRSRGLFLREGATVTGIASLGFGHFAAYTR